MSEKTALEKAKELLKAVKETAKKNIPSDVAAPLMVKDDMPHSTNSPEDKAHDIVEEDESIKHALAILDTPEKQKKMFEHLRTLQDESELRSPENEEAGQEEAMEKARIDEGKTTKQKVFGRQRRNEEMWPQRDKGIHRSTSAYSNLPKEQSVKSHKKVMHDLKQMPKPNLPKSEESMEKGAAHPNIDMKGVHKPVSDITTKEIPKAGKHLLDHTGRSYAGSAVRSKNIQAAKGHHASKLKELKAMPKPSLPKSEMAKEETKHDRCVTEVSKDPKIKNPHAVCVAAGVEPKKWKKEENKMEKSDKSALELAKELLKIAQENPEQFEEIMKATSVPMGMPKPKAPSIPKPKIPKPTATMQLKPAPTVMKEEKDESEEDESKESKEHEAKESKEQEVKEHKEDIKEEKSEESCSYKMTKAQIMEDLKKPWQPKFKKG